MMPWNQPHKPSPIRTNLTWAPRDLSGLGAALLAIALSACDWMPGKPDTADRWQPADEIADFTTLYSRNCRGCHGIDGTIAGSISLDQPTYLAFVGAESLRRVTAEGVPASNMPAYSQKHGGLLTEAQIDALVSGLMARKPESAPSDLPPYEAPLGDPVAGKAVFGASCASCHGPDGEGLAGKAGSVVDPAYLGLVSNQYLRTIAVAGRPELGCPDLIARTPGRVMTDQEVSDVTAWLVSNRRGELGQPEPLSQH